jgi:hypothetical protein
MEERLGRLTSGICQCFHGSPPMSVDANRIESSRGGEQSPIEPVSMHVSRECHAY